MKQVISLRINGETVTHAVEPPRTLLEFLRYDLGLTGSKQGCDKGDCGACTVLLDGEPTLACLSLAVACQGRDVTTIEGLQRGADLHPLQDAFDRHGAAQCGFCTPGMILSAYACLEREPGADEARIKEALSGNLCRCTGYTKIVDACIDAARRLREEKAP